MLVKIEDIIVKKRIRKDLGDLTALKESMRLYGLMNPVTLNADYELVAGERRLEAAKALGWERINATVLDAGIDPVRQFEMEIEENNQRKEFTDKELMDGYRRLERLRHPPLIIRLFRAIRHFFSAIVRRLRSLFSRKTVRTKPREP